MNKNQIAKRLLAAVNNLGGPEPTWQEMTKIVWEGKDCFRDGEREFIRGMLKRANRQDAYYPSFDQLNWPKFLFSKVYFQSKETV